MVELVTSDQTYKVSQHPKTYYFKNKVVNLRKDLRFGVEENLYHISPSWLISYNCDQLSYLTTRLG